MPGSVHYHDTQLRTVVGPLLLLAGASIAIFITGSRAVEALVALLATAGAALIAGQPRIRSSWVPLLLSLVFLLCTLAAFLPQELVGAAPWRAAFPAEGPFALATSVTPQPWLSWFWWSMLGAAFLAATFLLVAPVEGRGLVVFLHAVSLVVAAYTILAIVAHQTGWKYPFSGGAIFGFLPNKNHTATLMVVGAVVSFGLMQWAVVHGHRGAAILGALCGAPPLAGLLFFSNSRAGVVFLAFGLALWAVGVARGRAGRNILVATGVMVAFLLVLFLAGGSNVQERLSRLIQDSMATGAEGVQDVDFRQPIFRDTLKLVADVPLTGTGLGQFEFVFPQYRKESVVAAQVLHPESDWLMVVAESGLPAALALLGLVIWYFLRSWRGRSEPDGFLRWVAASAVGAAIAHGIVDVPWHRPALGWFLLVLAVSTLAPAGRPLAHPGLMRSVFALAGVALLAVSGWMASQQMQGVLPLGYRWADDNARLTEFGRTERYEEGEVLVTSVLAEFPLHPDAHYWNLAFTEATGDKLDEIIAGGRLVEPNLPRTPRGQVALWQGVDSQREAEAWSETVRRAAVIDRHQQKSDLPTASGYVRDAFTSLKDAPGAQSWLLGKLSGEPLLAAQGVISASPAVSSEWIAALANSAGYLDGLPERLRLVVLDKLVSLPDPGVALTYMQAQSGSEPGIYWQPLARYYARAGDKPRAVAIVAAAAGVPMEGGGRGINDFGRQLATLEGQGNDVSVRRLLKEAIEAKKPEADQLSVALAWFAASGDWDNAWRAASRLSAETKIGK